jgi:hypothetical protein
MLTTFKMLDGRDVAINPESVTECFGGESTTRICFCDGSYTDVEESFTNTVKKLNDVSMTNGIAYLIEAMKK